MLSRHERTVSAIDQPDTRLKVAEPDARLLASASGHSLAPVRERCKAAFVIELAAARMLASYAPEAVFNEVSDEYELRTAQEEGRLCVALSGEVPVGFAHVEIID